MIGPKLDARSYTNLILVVIAVLLAINLVAQPPQSRTLYTPEAEATQQVAEAVKQVAASNTQIAASLNRVADSIAKAGDQIAASLKSKGGAESSAYYGSPSSTGSSMSSEPGAPSSSAPSFEGTIEIHK